MEITTEDIIDEYKNEYKQKLLGYINKNLKEVDRHNYNIWVNGYMHGLEEFKKVIENGEFDNE